MNKDIIDIITKYVCPKTYETMKLVNKSFYDGCENYYDIDEYLKFCYDCEKDYVEDLMFCYYFSSPKEINNSLSDIVIDKLFDHAFYVSSLIFQTIKFMESYQIFCKYKINYLSKNCIYINFSTCCYDKIIKFAIGLKSFEYELSFNLANKIKEHRLFINKIGNKLFKEEFKLLGIMVEYCIDKLRQNYKLSVKDCFEIKTFSLNIINNYNI